VRDDDELIPVVGATTASYRWSQVSTLADNGVAVVKPNDVTANGRWLLWSSPVRYSPIVGGPSVTLDQLTVGPIGRVVLLDDGKDEEEIESLIIGSKPAVVIATMGDDPEDATLAVGHRWLTRYKFKITAIMLNARDRRESSQGSPVPGDIDPGANTIDAAVKVLLAGTQLRQIVDGIRAVRLGPGEIWISGEGPRSLQGAGLRSARAGDDREACPEGRPEARAQTPAGRQARDRPQ
jgi:hypothetical protein